jgi:hypothetical protein
MLRIAGILNNKAHWIFEAEEIPNLPPTPQGNQITLVDITNKLEVQEGWDYNPETGEFTEPEPIEIEKPPQEPELTQLDRIEATIDILLLKQEGIL